MNEQTKNILKRLQNINKEIERLKFIETNKPQKELFIKILSTLEKILKYLKKNNAHRKTKY